MVTGRRAILYIPPKRLSSTIGALVSCNHGEMGTFQVTVEPKPGNIDVVEGETVMSGAERLGYQWPTLCGGQGECRVCVMEVLSGASGLSAPDEREEAAIQSTFGGLQRRGRQLRQACRAEVVGGGVTVFKRGVRARLVDRNG